MTLYHFTTQKHLDGIRKRGLALGIVPWALTEGKDHFSFVPGWQWLTQESDWNQDWDAPFFGTAALPFRRTDVRITVSIPALYDYRAVRWLAWEARMKPPSAEFFDRYRSARFWYLYHGTIPPAWFLAIDQNPNRPESTHLDVLQGN